MATLQGKTAVITGAAGKGNMAQVIAKELSGEGARVLVSGRHAEELRRFADEIGGEWAICDITSREDNIALARAAVEKLGHIDIVVNAVGVNLQRPIALTSEEDLRRITDAHFIGPFLFFQAMLEVVADGASLIQISSVTATIMSSNHSVYMGTKAGFDHIIRVIANDYGKRGIRANSISPGLTETAMTAAMKAVPSVWETYEAKYPLGRVGTCDDIAAAVAWLASDRCFMSGQNLQVNGGLTLRGLPFREEVDAAVLRATGKPRVMPWEVG